MDKGRDRLTLRLSKELNALTKDKAGYLGISQNNLLLLLIDLGLKAYEAKPSLLEDE